MGVKGMKCPVCGKEFEVLARGKDTRFFRCSDCSNDLTQKIYWQPTTKLRAIKPIEIGGLIDVDVKPKSFEERS